MILTITANPAIDARYFLERLEVGSVVRCNKTNKTAGGKGLNVARVVDLLDQPVAVTGFLGGRNGEFIREEIQKAGYRDCFVSIAGETRTCLGILGADGTQTEILEKGPEVEKTELEAFLDALPAILAESQVVCISGSLPAGVEPDFYRQIIEMAKASGVKVILDTSGEAFRAGLQAGPDFIKPNREELSAYFGRVIASKDQAVEAARELLGLGVGAAAVSLGAEGAVLVLKDRVIAVDIPKVQVVNPVGSGDSFVAGLATAMAKGESLTAAMRLACACGTANAMEEKTGWIDHIKLDQILKNMIVSVKKA